MEKKETVGSLCLNQKIFWHYSCGKYLCANNKQTNKIKPYCFGNHFSVLYDSCVVTDILCGNCFSQTAKYFPHIASFSKGKMQTALESLGN